MPTPPSEERTRAYWFARIGKELAAADRDIGFAAVLRFLMMFEDAYAYSAELANGGDPEK